MHAIVGSFSGRYGSMTEGEPSRTYTYSGDEPGPSAVGLGPGDQRGGRQGRSAGLVRAVQRFGFEHIALADFVVADDLDDAAERVAFPVDLKIAPGEYLQIQVDSDNWAGFKLGGDEELGIWTSEGVLVDSVDWDEGDSGEGVSFARLPDGTGEFHTVVPTPGEENEHHH